MDYEVPQTLTVTIPATDADQTVVIDIPTKIDNLDENDETFTVKLLSAVDANGNNTVIADNTAQGTIEDDPSDAAQVSIADATPVVEGATAGFEVSLDNPSQNDVIVTFEVTPDTADVSDYEVPQILTVTIPATDADQTVLIEIPTKTDDLDENDETFNVVLKEVQGNTTIIAVDTAKGIIQDDPNDTAKVSIVDALPVQEGEVSEFVVSLDKPSPNNVTVVYTITPNTASQDDYTASPTGNIVISQGELTATIQVPTVVDQEDENDEQFTVTLNPVDTTNALVDQNKDTAIGVISDDPQDTAIVYIEGAPQVKEGNNAIFLVKLTKPAPNEVTVVYVINQGTASVNDYQATSPSSVVIQAGDLQAQISIPTVPDDEDENNEDFTVVLDQATNANIDPARNTATGTILDDPEDTAKISIFNAPDVQEGENAVFKVELDRFAPSDVEVTFAVSSNTNTAQGIDPADLSDYDTTNVSFTFTIPANTTDATITIPTVIDDLYEGHEEFIVTLLEANDANIVVPIAIARILISAKVEPKPNTYEIVKGEGLTTVNSINEDDLINGQPVVLGQNARVDTYDITSDQPEQNHGVTFDPLKGIVTVPQDAPIGTYTVTYVLCSTDLDEEVCSEPTTITIEIKDINLEVHKFANEIDVDGDGLITQRDQIEYTFTVINTGEVDLYNIVIEDEKVEVQGQPIDLLIGDSDDTTFTAVYQITDQDALNGGVENIAVGIGQDERGNQVEDESHNPNNLVGSSIPEGDTDPRGFTRSPRLVFKQPVPALQPNNTVTPNGDGRNETFIIENIELYNENTVKIFNRWGVLVYEKENYENANGFTGYSNGRIVIGGDRRLAEGTYFYVIEYTYPDDTSINPDPNEDGVYSGYLYLAR